MFLVGLIRYEHLRFISGRCLTLIISNADIGIGFSLEGQVCLFQAKPLFFLVLKIYIQVVLLSTALAKCIFFYNSRKAYRLGTYGVIRVSALAKVHFLGHFWQGLIFFSDCFFLSERLRFRSPESLKERAPASDDVLILYIVSPSEARAYISSSLCTLFLREQFCIYLVQSKASEASR